MKREKMQDGAGREISGEQCETWIVSQAIRNALEMFHGGGAYDPENPDSGEGFITDKQMRALNIVIRRTVHEAHDMFGKLADGDQEAMMYCWFHLGTVSAYMEPPGSPELEAVYSEIKHAAGESHNTPAQ